MEANNNQAALFIICPFCQLENYLRTKYGEDVFFMTSTAGILNFSKDEIDEIKKFIQREKINNIYLLNDVGCNFIEEAINSKKEFGLHAEQQLRKQLQAIHSKMSREVSLQEKKKIIAKNNVQLQAKYLASEKMLLYEIATSEINIYTLITNKHESTNHNFKLN